MKQSHWVVVCLIIFAVTLTGWAGTDTGTFQDSSGLAWVADPYGATSFGISGTAIMSRARAQEFIQAMNAGDVENFGHTDWRLASLPELQRLSRSEDFTGDVGTLNVYLRYAKAALRSVGSSLDDPNRITLRSGKNADLVYAWPVRAQEIGSGLVILATNSLWIKKDSEISG
jgi:hypothetical protein